MKDTPNAKQLISPWNNEEFLDAISIPLIEPGNRVKRKAPLTRKELAVMHREAEEDAAQEAAEKREKEEAARKRSETEQEEVQVIE